MISRRAHDVDLAIVGAGPAGSACALMAGRAGLRVALFEPQRAPIDKPCGEGLLPDGVRALERLGLRSTLTRARPFDRLTFTLPGAAPLAIHLPEPGLALERPALQAALDSAISAESNVARWAERVDTERQPGGFGLRTVSGGRWSARMLVAADGLAGRAAGWLRGARPRAAGRYGLRARYRELEAREGVEIRFGTDSELYLTPLPGGRVNAVVLLDGAPTRGAGAELEERLARAGLRGTRLGERVGAAEGRALSTTRPARLARGGAFLVGDATGGVDPILGAGVSIALASGIRAGEAATRIAVGEPSSAVEREFERDIARGLWSRRALAAVLQHSARHPTLGRGVARLCRSSERLRDGLVALAIGSLGASRARAR